MEESETKAGSVLTTYGSGCGSVRPKTYRSYYGSGSTRLLVRLSKIESRAALSQHIFGPILASPVNLFMYQF
jgi:hypothetical protein